MISDPRPSEVPAAAARPRLGTRLAVVGLLVVLVALLGWILRRTWSDADLDPASLWSRARIASSSGRWDEAELVPGAAGQEPPPDRRRTVAARPSGAPTKPARRGPRRARGRCRHRRRGGTDLDRARVDRVRAKSRPFRRDGPAPPSRPRSQARRAATRPHRSLRDRRLVRRTFPPSSALWRRRPRSISTTSISGALARAPTSGPQTWSRNSIRSWQTTHHRWARLALAENLRRLGRLDEAENALASCPYRP